MPIVRANTSATSVAQLVHGRHDDVARVFVVELLDALAEIGLDHLDADRRPCNGRKPHSSVSIDLLLISDLAPWSLRMPWTIWLCSAASRAQCTWMPLRSRIRFELLQIIGRDG